MEGLVHLRSQEHLANQPVIACLPVRVTLMTTPLLTDCPFCPSSQYDCGHWVNDFLTNEDLMIRRVPEITW